MEEKIGYIDLEEAKEFYSLRYGEANTEELEKALYRAFDKIEALGIRNRGEEKAFPRVGDKPQVLNLVKKAQLLEAIEIINSGDDDISKIGMGVTGKSIGDMSISYDGSKKIGDISFASLEASRILKRFTQKTF